MHEHGADIVVSDLAELLALSDIRDMSSSRQLPSALDCLNEIVPEDNRQPVLFLDYDGTLTPIVPHPDNAVLSDAMRATLQRLAGLCEIAIISGRDLDDVRERVGLNGIWYAGSHGFDIAGPANQYIEYQKGIEYLSALDTAEQYLRNKLATVPGCVVERKRFSIATHYRRAAQDKVEIVKQVVDSTHAEHPELRLMTGKKIFELQPDIDWDKGKALRWLMRILKLYPDRFALIYIGDDVTDEDAFRELAEEGVSILVAVADQPTTAAYRLNDPDAVQKFLNRLGDRLSGYRL